MDCNKNKAVVINVFPCHNTFSDHMVCTHTHTHNPHSHLFLGWKRMDPGIPAWAPHVRDPEKQFIKMTITISKPTWLYKCKVYLNHAVKNITKKNLQMLNCYRENLSLGIKFNIGTSGQLFNYLREISCPHLCISGHSAYQEFHRIYTQANC